MKHHVITMAAQKRDLRSLDESDENSLTGYVHNVSTLKTSARGRKYFLAMLQTSKSENLRMVGFAPEKYADFNAASSLESPVKITQAKLSPTKDGEIEVFIERSTKLQIIKRELDFKKRKIEEPKEQPSVPRQLLEVTDENMLSTVKVKVMKFLSEKSDVSTKYGLRSVRSLLVADETSNMKLTLWGKSIEEVKEQSYFQITRVVAKRYDGIMTLSTTTATVITPIPSFEDVFDLIEDEKEETLEMISINITCQLRCSNRACSTILSKEQANGGLIKCYNCGMKQKLQNLNRILAGTAIGNTAEEKETKFRISQEVLEKYLRDERKVELLNDTDALEDHFLDVEKFIIQHENGSDVLSKVSRA